MTVLDLWRSLTRYGSLEGWRVQFDESFPQFVHSDSRSSWTERNIGGIIHRKGELTNTERKHNTTGTVTKRFLWSHRWGWWGDGSPAGCAGTEPPPHTECTGRCCWVSRRCRTVVSFCRTSSSIDGNSAGNRLVRDTPFIQSFNYSSIHCIIVQIIQCFLSIKLLTLSQRLSGEIDFCLSVFIQYHSHYLELTSIL